MGMEYHGGLWWGLAKLAYFVLASFIFGIVFWWTKAIVHGHELKKKRKKRR